MKLTFTGDILIYESQDKSCRLSDGKYDYKSIFEQVKPLLDSSDYVVGSFETTTAGKNARYTHEATSFNTPDGILSALKWSGFDLLTTANNHCFDRGFEGHKRTIEKIKEYGLEYTGTRISSDEQSFIVKDFDGTHVAFIAYTYGTNSRSNGCLIPIGKEYLVNLTRPQDIPIYRPLWKRIAKRLLSIVRKKISNSIQEDCVSSFEVTNGRNKLYEEKMLATIREAKSKADIVIMCLHSGGQFNSKIGAYTNHLLNSIANEGIDAIICNHAHTILPIYYIGNCLVASALGNFSFVPGEGYWVDGVMAEYSVLLNLDIVDKKIIGYNVDICKCMKNNDGLGITIPLDKKDCKYNDILKRLVI